MAALFICAANGRVGGSMPHQTSVWRERGASHDRGLVNIGNEGKRIDWNAIRAEYIGGGTSYRILAEKYGVSKDMIARVSKAENWAGDRDKVRDRATTKIIQKTADAVASNAAKLERAKGLAIDRLLAILERYPEDAGDAYKRFGDGTENKYSLLNIVTAIEKLDRNSTIDGADDPLTKLFRRMDDDVRSDVQP